MAKKHKPRDYQLITTSKILEAMDRGIKRMVAALATGMGKGLCIADLIETALMQEKKVLVMVHSREIVKALHKEIREYCGLDELQIGIEMEREFASVHALVVVASTQTLYSPLRLDWFKPDIIISDECHRSATKGNLDIYERFGVNDGRCVHVGFSATVYRADRKALFARYPDGTPFQIESGKSKRVVNAKLEDCVFDELVVDYNTQYGTNNGWLVDGRIFTCETDEDISDIPSNADGEFNMKKLSKRINNAKRTNKMINFWRGICPYAQTIVFCADVDHAVDTVELLQKAGYTAAEVNGKTDKMVRDRHILEFNCGKLQFLVNVDVFKEGTNLPKCNCIILLRPTRWWGKLIQMIGRVLRPWPGVLDPLQDASPEERLLAIAASPKPFAYILDAYDKAEGLDVCHPPAVFGLPNNLRAEGESMREVEKKIKEFCEETGRDVTKIPLDFEEVEVIIGRHKDLSASKAKVRDTSAWEPTVNGYRFTKTPPGYSAELVCNENGKQLVIKHKGEDIKRLSTAAGMEDVDLHHFLNKAAEHCNVTVAEHIKANPKFTGNSAVEKGVGYLSDKMKVQFLKMYKLQESSLDRMSKQKIEEMKQRMFATWNRGK